MKRTITILIIFSTILFNINLNVSCSEYDNRYIQKKVIQKEPVRISVFPYRGDDDFINSISRNLEKIQAENPDKVSFTFYDSKYDQKVQNQNIDKAIKSGTEVLLVNLVDVKSAKDVINKIKENNLPAILYNREPLDLNPIKSYNKALYIGTDSSEAGVLQGKIIVDDWKSKKNIMDRNKDDKIQYILLMGEPDNVDTFQRTKYVIETIEKAGIKLEELDRRYASWDQELARRATEPLFFRYGDKIEVIISNDDSMAEGAISALQSHGYNLGDEKKNIAVYGVNATEKAKELIAKGFMSGTVLQDAEATAEALYEIALNMDFKKNPLDGTNYKFDETGVSIHIPYKIYKPESR